MTKEELGVYLTNQLSARNLTVKGLADEAGMNYEVVRSAVRGHSAPSWENVNRMLHPLGLCLSVVPLASDEVPTTQAEVSAAAPN